MRSTEGPDFSIDTAKNLYTHEVGWIAQTGCEPGFLAQKIDRSFKYSVGSVDSRGRWTWGQETVCRARYWEIWEIVDAPAGRGSPQRIRIYPGVHSSLALLATSRGLLTRDELKIDTNKRPAAQAENFDYVAHDLFEESRPKAQLTSPMKGRFKIKGTVYYLPSGRTGEHAWVTGFLDIAERNKQHGISNKSCYTGGPLWQCDGTMANPPGSALIITRYEAGKFYDVRTGHIPSTCTNAPDIDSYSRSRPYPWHPDN